MKHISILIPEGDCSLTHIEATHQILSEVNVLLELKGRPPIFKIQLVGLNKESKLKKGVYTIAPDILIADLHHTDLIIIPAVQGRDLGNALRINEPFLPWIVQRFKEGSAVASLCLGSFLLASTGLLKGKKCTTHWSAADAFRELFPDVELMTEKILTDENGIYSSGGALSFTNLIVYLIDRLIR